MKHVLLLILVFLQQTACAATESNYAAPPLRSLISGCAKSENCYIFDGHVARQVISTPVLDPNPTLNLCLAQGSIIDTVRDGRTEHSGMLDANCKKERRIVAFITLWYFPDGRYDLTLQNCIESVCGKRYRPI
jgi:hypothetical protein